MSDHLINPIGLRKLLGCLLTKGSEVEFKERRSWISFQSTHRTRIFFPVPRVHWTKHFLRGFPVYSGFPLSSKTNIILNWFDMIWFNLICTELHVWLGIIISYYSFEGPYQPLTVWRLRSCKCSCCQYYISAKFVWFCDFYLFAGGPVGCNSLTSEYSSLAWWNTGQLCCRLAIFPGFHR